MSEPTDGDITPEGREERRGLLGRRVTRSTVLATVLTLALGVAISTQIASTQDRGLESLQEAELISILDSVTSRSARLEDEARALEVERARLADGRGDGPEAVERARTRIDDLGVLVGTAAAEGPGVTVTITDTQNVVTAGHVLDLVQELRDAGAEAMQVGDVRVVASTSFVDEGGGIRVDGQPVSSPITVVAIGDDRTLASALAIPGGVEETVRQVGATIRVDPADRVLVNALHAPREPRYARPVTPPETESTP